MRVAIVSRIFEPEPSAAAVRLNALAEELTSAGNEVSVLTVRLPKGQLTEDDGRAYRVMRAPVLRDRSGYVRGYAQYMSFDIVLFLRILFGKRQDVFVVEPPPTTGFFVRMATWIRRTPYVYYAADIWADAASQTKSSQLVLRLLRWVEQQALRGARAILAVSDGVEQRLGELGVSHGVTKVGNGVDVRAYGFNGTAVEFSGPTILYAGTASEWHGAEVVTEAYQRVLLEFPDARLLFIGGGTERSRLQSLAIELGVSETVDFLPTVAPNKLAEYLRAAHISVATCRPGAGYDFAFPTKLYSSVACGTPVVFAGPGPAQEFVRTKVGDEPIGLGVPWESSALAEAFRSLLGNYSTPERRSKVAEWAATEVSVARAASLAAEVITRSAGKLLR